MEILNVNITVRRGFSLTPQEQPAEHQNLKVIFVTKSPKIRIYKEIA